MSEKTVILNAVEKQLCDYRDYLLRESVRLQGEGNYSESHVLERASGYVAAYLESWYPPAINAECAVCGKLLEADLGAPVCCENPCYFIWKLRLEAEKERASRQDDQ